jgi:hypothetical protein
VLLCSPGDDAVTVTVPVEAEASRSTPKTPRRRPPKAGRVALMMMIHEGRK